jgi:hypothetical protein
MYSELSICIHEELVEIRDTMLNKFGVSNLSHSFSASVAIDEAIADTRILKMITIEQHPTQLPKIGANHGRKEKT